MKIKLLEQDFLIYIVTEKGDMDVTKEIYKNDIEEFISLYSSLDTCDLNSDIYDDYLAYLMDKNYKRSTILRKMTTIKNFYIFLNKKGYIKSSIKQLETPKKEIRLPKVLTEEEISRLLESSKEDILAYTMILFDLSTGLRVSELINIKYDNLSLVQRYVKVKGKRNKDRIVPFSLECLTVLNTYLKGKDKKKSNYVFTNNKYKKISRQTFYQMLRKYSKLASINKTFGPHVLRHTFATRLINSGAKLRQVQVLLGHSQIETTEIYTHVNNKQIHSIYDEKINR